MDQPHVVNHCRLVFTGYQPAQINHNETVLAVKIPTGPTGTAWRFGSQTQTDTDKINDESVGGGSTDEVGLIICFSYVKIVFVVAY